MADEYLDALQSADRMVLDAELELDRVPRPVMAIWLVGQLEFEVACGGVVQWLTNHSGRYTEQTIAVLSELGAPKCADIVRRIIEHVPSSLPTDDAARARLVASVPAATAEAWRELADALLEWPDDIDTLLRRYVASNIDAFATK